MSSTTVAEFASELKIMINANDEQLLEVSLALDENMIAGLLWRDGFYLNKPPLNRAVRTTLVRTMTAKTEFDFGVDLS